MLIKITDIASYDAYCSISEDIVDKIIFKLISVKPSPITGYKSVSAKKIGFFCNKTTLDYCYFIAVKYKIIS